MKRRLFTFAQLTPIYAIVGNNPLFLEARACLCVEVGNGPQVMELKLDNYFTSALAHFGKCAQEQVYENQLP